MRAATFFGGTFPPKNGAASLVLVFYNYSKVADLDAIEKEHEEAVAEVTKNREELAAKEVHNI